MAAENAIDVSGIKYDVELLTENGKRWLLSAALISLQWEENKNELAQRATLELANIEIGDSQLITLAKLNCGVLIYAEWSGVRSLILEGAIWEWQYTNSTQKTITVTVYDNLVRLQKSKDFKYYSAGQTTVGILGDICSSWGVPLNYQWGASITHEKKVFNGDRISDMIITLLDEVRSRTGKRYIASLKGGKLTISGYGANSTVYRFDGLNTISVSDKLSINDLVTQVKVLGKQDDDGRAAVEALVKGDTRFGVLQEIVRTDNTKDTAAATAEAKTILQERGSPERTTTVNVPDLPFLRKGDKVEVKTESLNGFFFVTAVTHNATQKKMTLTLTDSAVDKTNSGSGAGASSGSVDGYTVGDVVNFLGGNHWYSSTATNPTGGERTAGTAKVTNLAGGAAHPIHLIGVTSNVYGWVNTNQISKSSKS